MYQVTLLPALSINRFYNDCLEPWTRPINNLHTLGYADISLYYSLLGIDKSDTRRRRPIGRAFTITLTGYIILRNRTPPSLRRQIPCERPTVQSSMSEDNLPSPVDSAQVRYDESHVRS